MEKKKLTSNSLQDIVFLSGIIIFTSILVIGLFPGRLDAGLIDENFFITTLMTIPVIAGIYFIVISFRRNINIESVDIRQSIKKKMTMAFVFIAVLSALPIVIISSNYFNSSLSKMFSHKTMMALDRSVAFSSDYYVSLGEEIRLELETIRGFMADRNFVINENSLKRGAEAYGKKELSVAFIIDKSGNGKTIGNQSALESSTMTDLVAFYRNVPGNDVRVDRLQVRGHDLISGAMRTGMFTVILWKDIPSRIKSLESLFVDARNEYRDIENRKNYFESGAGPFLMFLSIFIIGIAYLISLYMSGNITKPVLDLSAASREIAQGNYVQKLEKRSDDELGVLVDSFNRMARQLDEKRKIMFQKQRLEAWNEMARKLVHEIKNPLTPIRLAAERMRKLTVEGNSNRDEAVKAGSETIINEVSSLLKLVSEFSTFARMPEKKPELSRINKLIGESVTLFSAHENIDFKVLQGENIPETMLDRVLIRQALNNLITNAVQAIPGNGSVTVTSCYDIANNEIIVSVGDTGTGISGDDLERIFEPGYTSRENGTGLGLAIVEKIVFEHDGSISCESSPGEGSVFTIKLPVLSGGDDGINTDS